jgi:hypothetical protein
MFLVGCAFDVGTTAIVGLVWAKLNLNPAIWEAIAGTGF